MARKIKLTAILAAVMMLLMTFTAHAVKPEPATHLFLIGDSRTEMMSQAVGAGSGGIVNHWFCESGKGLGHMTDVAFPGIDAGIQKILAEEPDARIRVLCMYGVNDPHNVRKYAERYNALAERYADTEVKFYFVSVNPIADEKSSYRYDKDIYVTTFNDVIRPLLSERVEYIDTYSKICGMFREHTRDGVHYSNDLSRQIYAMLVEAVTKDAPAEKETGREQGPGITAKTTGTIKPGFYLVHDGGY